LPVIRYVGKGNHTVVLSGIGRLRFPGPDVEVSGDVADKLLRFRSPDGTPMYERMDADIVETVAEIVLPDPPKRLFKNIDKEPGVKKAAKPRQKKPKGPQPDIFSKV
jgi:hypothetical protein